MAKDKNITISVTPEMKEKLSKLPYGQLSQLVFLFLQNILTHVDNNSKIEYLEWAYGKETLTLQPKDKING